MSQTVVRNVLLFDGVNTHKDATVVFDGQSGKIESVSTSGKDDQAYPSGAVVIDGRGHTLLPGLIDFHIHAHELHLPPGSDRTSILTTPLKAGVTTICDMHCDPAVIGKFQGEIKKETADARSAGKSGRVKMADLKSCHYGATIEGGWPVPVVLGQHPSDELLAEVKAWPKLSTDNAVDFVKSHKLDGADYIKLMQENCCSLIMPTDSIPVATLELQTAVVKAAHAEGMLVVGHALDLESTRTVLKSGANGLTHTFVDQPPSDAIVDLYKKTGAFVIPTLVVLSSLTTEEQHLRERFAEVAVKKGLLDQAWKDNMLSTMSAKAETSKLDYAYQTIRRLKNEGVDVVAGTDSAGGLAGTGLGPSLWMELEMYVEKCGLSITDALATATSVGAKRFGFNDRGQVEKGRRADLVLVKGDVTEKLSNLWENEGIVGVWKEGIPAA